jgi:ribosomal protein S18 acetylase RimI-like enzyme
MSAAGPFDPSLGASPTPAGAPVLPSGGCVVRAATHEDVAAVADAIGELLFELGGEAPSVEAMGEVVRTLIDDPAVGAVLVAELDGALAGVLAASWQTAVHVPGRYGVIQDLWVDPSLRSRAIGRELVAALCAIARESGMGRIEVGLPQEGFAALAATRAFYLRNGFTALGPRMRRRLT